MRNALSLALGFLIATAASGQVLYELDPDIDLESGVSASSAAYAAPDVTLTDNISIRVDFNLLRSSPGLLGFPLPDGELLWVVRTDFEDLGEGNVTWSGRESASDYNSVLLSLHDGRLMGKFSSGEDEWMLLGLPTGGKMRRVIRGTVPPNYLCQAPFAPDMVNASELSLVDSELVFADRAASSSAVTQDILVVYTKEANEYVSIVYAGYALGDLARYANQVTNEVYSNGQIPATTNVVGVEPMPADYDHSADPGIGYTWGEQTLDVQTDDLDLKKLRAQYGADIVYAYIYDTGRACGEAWTRVDGTTDDRAFAKYAHAYTNLYCDSPWWYKKSRGKRWVTPYYETMAHEVGHIHGALHDRATTNLSEADALMPYAFGYIDHASRKKTVMANKNGSAGWHVNYYSTVRVSPNGWTLGETNRSENERVMQAMVASTSRLSDYVRPPAAPTDFWGKPGVVPGSVVLYWTDNAMNESAYEVKWGLVGRKAQTRTYPHDEFPNLPSAYFHSLRSGKEYRFKVFAVNEYGKTGTAQIRVTPN